ncbi:MAG: hypothetical protein PHV59_06420 [Victivallales bacterium]|nr:hypothetical protein [Victivallales bacterium]
MTVVNSDSTAPKKVYTPRFMCGSHVQRQEKMRYADFSRHHLVRAVFVQYKAPLRGLHFAWPLKQSFSGQTTSVPPLDRVPSVGLVIFLFFYFVSSV